MSTDFTPHSMITLFQVIAHWSPAIYGNDDLRPWMLAADLDGWQREPTTRAVIEHCRGLGKEAPWIKPGDVTARLRTVREVIMTAYREPDLPDPDLPDRPREYLAWQREQRRRFRAVQLRAYAASGELPTEPRPQPLGNRLAEVLAAAPEHARPAIEAGLRRVAGRKL